MERGEVWLLILPTSGLRLHLQTAWSTVGQRHYPHVQQTAVYQIHKEQMTGKPLLAKSTFLYSLRKGKFPDVIILKIN